MNYYLDEINENNEIYIPIEKCIKVNSKNKENNFYVEECGCCHRYFKFEVKNNENIFKYKTVIINCPYCNNVMSHYRTEEGKHLYTDSKLFDCVMI